MVKEVPVKWLARQQRIVAKSTCEAEYIAAAEATKLTIYMQKLVAETRLPTTRPTMHIVNTPAAQMAKTTQGHNVQKIKTNIQIRLPLISRKPVLPSEEVWLYPEPKKIQRSTGLCELKPHK